MNRFCVISALSLLGAVGGYAGTLIPIDLTTGANAGVLTKNLLGSGYIPCMSGTCNPSNTVAANPPSGTSTSFSSVVYNGTQVPFDIASGGGTPGGTNADNTSNNIWAPTNASGTQSVVVDVGGYTGSDAATTGIQDVDEIFTMLNDWYATAGTQGISLLLTGVASNGTTAITESVNLVAGVDYRSIGSGANLNHDPTPCDIANIGTATLGSNCTGDSSPTAQSSATDSTFATFSSTGPTSELGGSVTVYNSVYTSKDAMSSPDNYWLDAQAINLGGAFATGYLDSITIESKDGTGISEKAILSAVSVDSTLGSSTTLVSPTPEPGTVVLLVTGLAGIGFLRILRRMQA